MGTAVPPELAEALGWTGVEWPAIDAQAWDAMADAYNVYAGEVDAARMDADAAATEVVNANKGSAVDTFAGYWGQVSGAHLVGVFNAAKEMVGAFRNAAIEVRNAQSEGEGHLRTLQQKVAGLRAEGRVPPAGPPGDIYEVSSARAALEHCFQAMTDKVGALLGTARDKGGLAGLTHQSGELVDRDLEAAAPTAPASAGASPAGHAPAARTKIAATMDPGGGP
ncbi:hypothetical protein [Embleya sp. NPDC059237]|uniref:hypothetical protein n=1 Tax=Embleya sp. NPDC059237 TaxID=3346784 RepID=UPI00367B4075